MDSADKELGSINKMEAHRLGLLHRAISVIVVNSKGELLLQQRAHNKYHSPGLWTNSCCSHPYPGEDASEAGKRRLKEEMGITAELEFLFKFQYRTKFPNCLVEHELDHVLYCQSDEIPTLDPQEAVDWRYMSLDDVKTDIRKNPARYSYWFKRIVERLDPLFASRHVKNSRSP